MNDEAAMKAKLVAGRQFFVTRLALWMSFALVILVAVGSFIRKSVPDGLPGIMQGFFWVAGLAIGGFAAMNSAGAWRGQDISRPYLDEPGN